MDKFLCCTQNKRVDSNYCINECKYFFKQECFRRNPQQQKVSDLLMPYNVESINELIVNVRNKAIDEFVTFANTMPTVENEDGEIRPMWLEEMAEHLKEGRTYD